MLYHRSSWRRLPLCVFALTVTALVARPRTQSATATIVYPPDGTMAADFSRAIQWTTVPNVLAYYLYVGTSPGAKDLVNTGEIPQTSYLASDLPADRVLYARMWTKSASGWQFVDSTFSATSVQSSKIAFPADGTVANLYNPFRWTRVANVEAYYLYVGTTVGAKDLVNTGETQQTSYLSPGLPTGTTLYARMWTKAAGVWRYVDSTFTAAPTTPLTATLTYPTAGAANVDVTQPLQWTSVANVQAYYLYVGYVVGANDLVNTGETLHTSYLAASLPSGRVLYAVGEIDSFQGAKTGVVSAFAIEPKTGDLVTPGCPKVVP